MHEVLVTFEMGDESGAGLPDARTRFKTGILGNIFQRLAREAREKLLRPHVRQIAVRTDRFARKPRDDAAVRHTTAA